ncbi:MAG: hypothetical protein HZA46_05080 [Planctomycetales bacterium]|nr:hypothetical protein [Planctomycetales bacterium]
MKRLVCLALGWFLLTMATGCCCDLFNCGRGCGYPAPCAPACAPGGY